MADKTILTSKLVDLSGLSLFWTKAKEYVTAQISAVNAVIEENERVTAEALTDLDSRVVALRNDVDALGGADGGIQGMIDSSIADLDLPNKYDAKGAAAAAQTASKVTMTASGDNTSGVKKYEFFQGGTSIGVINLPKDLVVTKGEVVICQVEGENKGKKCIELTLTSGDVLHIPVDELVDVYTGGDYVTVSSDNVISVDKAGIIAGLAEADKVYSKTEADALLNAKANSADVYSKTEADNLLNAKANSADVYTKTQVDGLVSPKADKTYVDTELGKKANSADVYTKGEVDTELGKKANATELAELVGVVKGVYENSQLTQAGHQQRIEALESVAIATDDEIIALFA